MDFDELADRAQDAPGVVVKVSSPAVSWQVREALCRYYRIGGAGLWTAEARQDGVHLRRLFYGDHEYRTWAQWAAECASGHVMEVR